MDQSTVSSEAPERAVSSEPSSTRPNPFAEGDEFSRKRRRTSLSGASRSRSVESTRSGLATSSSPAAEHLPDHPSTQDSAMKIDTDPSTPQTPELQSTAQEPPTEPPSSRVTINLRNATLPFPSSSSPVSPTPPSLPIQPVDSQHGIKKSVEDSEMDMFQAPIEISDTPPSASSSMQSPDVEVVAIPDDDQNAAFDDEVSIIQQDAASLDPTPDFPYHEPHESLSETVTKLVNYLAPSQAPPEEAVLESLRSWMGSYLRYVSGVGVKAAYESHNAYHNFWHMFPDIAWMLSNRKQSFLRDSRHVVADFFRAYTKLTSILVEFDFLTAQSFQKSPGVERRQPDFLLGRYVPPLVFLARREETRPYNGQLPEEEILWAPAWDGVELMNIFQTGAGSIRWLNKLTQMHMNNAPRYQHLMDVLTPIANIAALILQKTVQVVRGQQSMDNVAAAKVRMAEGHQLYDMVTGAFTTAIEKNVTQLSNDNTQTLITSLSEILRISLNGDHKLAIEQLKVHRQSHPEVPLKFTPDAISLEWRLGVFGKLITSSQMQLRVMAASTMCHDLVNCWKKHADTDDDGARFLTYIAQYLLGTKLVDYILGPTCHPEITVESGNIVGFLVVTRFYRNEQTDLLWQTITTAQDPRVSEALIRMTTGIASLFFKEELLYLCEKLHGLPIDNFTPSVRNLCEVILRFLNTKFNLANEPPSILPLSLCIRLLRESSVYSSESHIAHPDVHRFAMDRFRDLARDGLEPEIRREFYIDCIGDIAAKSSTTLGTLWCLSIALRPAVANELRILTTEHNLTTLLVDELAHAIEQSKRTGITMVLCEPVNYPRRDLINCILHHEPATITSILGPRLWDMLVGHGAACQQDRNAGWAILNNVPGTALANPFLSVCFNEYLPNLPRDGLCEGALQFVRSAVLPRVNDINGIILDDDESLAQSGVEHLWRMILDADHVGLVDAAIQTLVCSIYIDSKSILAYPHHRACQVHLGLVNRCLKQMEEAAKRLDAFSNGTGSGHDEPMVTVATEEHTREQERIFTRSLAVLRQFLKAHQAKAHFSAPDLRALTPGSPSVTEGESAELKLQSFDGNQQTAIVPLEVGRQNTAASLLASIRQVTGFDNYRIYYRGHLFAPKENDVCRSLEELKIHDGLILVKREEHGTATASKIKPGASLLEIEIMGHFEQLWNYLSMQEVLAREIHSFLIKLPADAHMLAAFDSPDTSYRQIFPLCQPFKSLYAIYAMREYMDSAARRLRDATSNISDAKDAAVEAYLEALVRVRKLVVAAISDVEILNSCASEALKNRLTFNLMNVYMLTFREPDVFGTAIKPKAVAVAPADRLVDILTSTTVLRSSDAFVSLIASTFTAILRSAAIDSAFWASLKAVPSFEELIGILLLDEHSDTIRANIAKLIEERVIRPEESTPNTRSFCEYLWPVLYRLIPRAVELPKQCQQVFGLSQALLETLALSNPPAVDIPELTRLCGSLLLEHESTEQLGNFSSEDAVACGLVKLLHVCLSDDMDTDVGKELPANLGQKLFWRHLFPPPRQDYGGPVRTCILSTETRAILTDVIFSLVRNSEIEFDALLADLESLVTYDEFDSDPYLYELQVQFDRVTAVRAPCGYAGLRNLSNTCYLNSLFTQLFMNTGFRQFMMNARIPDQMNSHDLLRETRKLFAFMQESSRKFIDPSMLVGSIKTYEDTVIDVHNQMDVDEFYNLLFDRWEGQLSTVEDRKTLRSFYGGQLVQQVASKECEHISERLEPFSAIQCDIKGKSTLQDSLQAYVDGEIMEGDNKYKCSNCDRHVDAVKRACLKDIPDNLIFHLKRFDFNLRTLMRSKINDHFSFPTKIDMRPYTIEHLGSPSESGEEDIFELVGVLVHAGTAESGHYYSYIRERPTAASSEAWYEFNDDSVSPWNPADLEKSTFGGPDVPFDNGVAYDKTYSAYMLFYERSSVLKADQSKLQSLSLPTPLKVKVPAAVAEHIMGENNVLLRRHCLYDPNHSKFVLKMFEHTMVRYGGICSTLHGIERRAMYMLLGHLDQVASRTKDLPDFELFRDKIDDACINCARCATVFIEYFQERHEAFRHLLQRNPDPSVRFATGSMFIAALRKIKSSAPALWGLSRADALDEPVMMQVIQIFDTLWNNFHANIRSWPEVFQTVLAFAKMGPLETALLLSEDWLVKVLRIVFADTNIEMPNNYVRMLTNVIRRLNNTRLIQYEMVIQLIDHFMGALEDVIDVHTIVENAEMRLEISMEHDAEKLSWTPEEVNILLHEWTKGAGSTFVKKLIELNQDPRHTASIIGRVVHLNPEMDQRVFSAIKTMLTGQMVQYSVAPYISAAIVFSEQSRNASYVQGLFRHIANQCRNLQNPEGRAFLNYFKVAFASLQNESGELRAGRYFLYIENIPLWAPSLLGYYDGEVRRDTEDFLTMWLSNHIPDGKEDEKLAIAVNMAARKLAMNCLFYLKENFVLRRAQVAKQTTESLQNIVQACEMFFLVDLEVDGERVISNSEFQDHYRAIIEPLRRMTVEELEDEGSDWENSCASSEPLESLADISMQAAGDLPDADVL